MHFLFIVDSAHAPPIRRAFEAEVAAKYGWEDVYAGKPIGASWMIKMMRMMFDDHDQDQPEEVPCLRFWMLPPTSHLMSYTHAYWSPVLVPHPCAAAEATNPPPDQTPLNDLRPQHWVEQSRNGDSWVLSKDGAWDMIKSSSVASLCQQTV